MNILKRTTAIALFCATSALPFTALAQQPAPAAPVPVRQGTPINPPAAEPGTIVVEPAPLPPPLWGISDAQQLLAYIRNIGTEGLNPSDYDPNGLAAAIAAGDPVKLSEVATDRFNRVSSDLALGNVRGKDRIDWHIKDPDLDGGRQDKLLRWALHTHQITDTLIGLLPTHPQYASLKHALVVTPAGETDKINRIRLNLDRWRWLPRDLGERYIIVNVPAYTAALVEKGETLSRHYAVAGKISTPTPQLSAMATGVILNPWWEIPKSIEGEVRGKSGYVAVKDKNGKAVRWRQPPGPSNALGKVKFVMPNSKAIYLHDTNAKSRFNSRVRAFSHGCIRTKDIIQLATILLTEGESEWTSEKVQDVLASGKSVQASFSEPLPVYIVYMSSAAHVDGRIIDYADVYKRDGKAIAALIESKAAPEKVATR
ncbi:MAG TPA: L,D-transpeptidase family protein [Sphingomicrobium sp.]|nr:L,D-transpeptidase family protein [Sphingomicrobium sp.]